MSPTSQVRHWPGSQAVVALTVAPSTAHPSGVSAALLIVVEAEDWSRFGDEGRGEKFRPAVRLMCSEKDFNQEKVFDGVMRFGLTRVMLVL